MLQVQGRKDVAEASSQLDLGVFEASTVIGALEIATDARIVRANSLMRQWLSVAANAPLGRITDFLSDDSWSEWCRATGSSGSEVSFRAADGAERRLRGDVWVCGEGRTRRIVAVLVDASDRYAMRATALRSARMEALGSLTAGVAHDFNNLLTVLVGNLYLLGEELRERPRVFEKLKAARDAAKRGTDLIKQLLRFARREEFTAGIVEPCKVIETVVPLLRRALGTRIKLETTLSANCGSVRASAAQLESVIVNLAVNARDAIAGKGRVVIAVSSVEVGDAEAALRRLRPGSYTAISVADTGSGIPPDAIGRVFEPFFSTKTEQGGTGLGLSMVRWFAEQSQGAVSIESVVGQGTTVSLFLPVQAPAPAQEANEGTMPLSTLPSGSERVVVLAHDEALRATMHHTLEVLGYRVKVVSGAEDVVSAVAEAPTQLILFDGFGPAEDEALRRARSLAPRLNAVVTMDVASGMESPPPHGTTWLNKPFSLGDLAGVVRRALDSSS